MAVKPPRAGRRKFSDTLSFKLVAYIDAMIVAIIFAISVFLILDKQKTLNDAMLAKYHDFAKFASNYIYATYLDFAVYSEAPEELKAHLSLKGTGQERERSIFRDNPDILRFMIVHADGEVILDSDDLEGPLPSYSGRERGRYVNARIKAAIAGLRPYAPAIGYTTIGGERVLEIIAPNTMAEGRHVYAIAYYVSLSEVTRQVTTSTLLIVLISAIAILFVYALTSRLAAGIVKPILDLRDQARRIADGEYGSSTRIAGRDEIAELSGAFNEMSVRLKDSFSRIDAQFAEIVSTSDKLQRTKDHLNNVFDSLSSILITIDVDGMITQWNKTAVAYTGISRESAVSRRLSDLIPFFETMAERIRSAREAKGQIALRREKIKLTEHDTKRIFDIFIYPLGMDPTDDTVIRIDDATELCTKEEQLVQAQKMETVGTLAGGLAHDFNNVLGGIVGTLSILKYQLSDFDNLRKETLEEHIAIMEHSGERARDMVRQLLSLSRRQEVDFVPVDLNLIVDAVYRLCSNTLDKSIDLRKSGYPSPAMIRADPTQIEQSILNLCVNASHAMTIMRSDGEPGGGTLSMRTEQVRTDEAFCLSHPEAAPDAIYWRVQVQDTGIGMKSSTIAKIFDPFFSTKPKGIGTGLGLSMVYNIVRQHGGFIDVYSEIGKGSMFSIYLPVFEGSGEASAQAARPKEPYRGSGTVLVIDDEETIRIVAKAILSACGFTVILAEDGATGLDSFEKHADRINIVLVDMVMPKRSGRETIAEIRKRKPDVKIVLSSGFSRDEKVNEVLRQGADDFIQKPYTFDNLTEVLRRLLG